MPSKGRLRGRVLDEAMPGGRVQQMTPRWALSTRGSGGLQTMLRQQVVGKTVYNDVAGFSARTVGLRRAGHAAASRDFGKGLKNKAIRKAPIPMPQAPT